MTTQRPTPLPWPTPALVLAALVSAGCALAAAQEAAVDPDQEARRIFTTIMSPYCPGQLLADCGSAQAEALRDTIKARLQRGVPPEAIVDDLVASFGPEVLALPPNEGVGRVAWLGPIAALAASLLLILSWQRERRATSAAGQSAQQARAEPEDGEEAEMRTRLRRELDDLDS